MFNKFSLISIFSWLTKLNVLKLIVLVGTFALAMAFAGNDLVNFIGVPLAGYESFNSWIANPGADPGNFLMTGLTGKVKTPTLFLLVAGLIMVITLWFSKKAKSVTKTELNLARQDAGFERFGSSGFARTIVRATTGISKGVNAFLPNSVLDLIEKRFDQSAVEQENDDEEAPAFDLIRASVNLVVASILISFATSLKLPLSTTYVTFMVAMGTSLSDKAWGRESAVYRITGVFSVIGGWFLTAFSAFTIALIVAFALYYGGIIAMGILLIIAVLLIYRTHGIHKKVSAKETEQGADVNTISNTNIAPIHRSFQKYNSDINHLICHTGQHFDNRMSKVFFDELQMPKPHFYLGIGGGSHAEQTSRIMVEFEKVILTEKPDLVIVPGDVNSTIAASLVATKLHIPVAHVESGLRSFDRKMPEEINRVLTDHISDFLFVTEESGLENLKNEGINSNKVFFTGNVMIDSLVNYLPVINKSQILSELKIETGSYVLATFHRPSNVDEKENLKNLIVAINEISTLQKVVFPIHPRTANNLKKYGLWEKLSNNIITSEPLGYIDFLSLTKNAELVITDSGGIQEETTFLNVQCITVRDNTERPITSKIGTNHMIGTNLTKVVSAAKSILAGNIKNGSIPELWDGKASERIAQIIYDSIKNK